MGFDTGHLVEQPGYGLSFIDRLGDHAFGAGGDPHRIESRGVGDAVDAGEIA
jgi:hypothetical protein